MSLKKRINSLLNLLGLTIFLICITLSYIYIRVVTNVGIPIFPAHQPNPAWWNKTVPAQMRGENPARQKDRRIRSLQMPSGIKGGIMSIQEQINNLRNSITFKYDSINAILAGRSIDQLDGDEASKASRLMSEIEVLDLRTSNLELNQPTSRPIFDLGLDDGVRSGGKVFKSFADQIDAIVRAGKGLGVDSRLSKVATEYRAASGLSELVPADGGFLLEPTFSKDILMSAFTTGQIIRLVRQIPIATQTLMINALAETARTTGSRWGGITGFWAAEGGTKTPSAPKFRRMELSLKKMIGLCYSTDELLADAGTLQNILSQGFASEVQFMVEDAVINGTGVGQPLGIMNSGALIVVTRVGANAIAIGDIVNMWSRMINAQNAVWLTHSTVLPQIYQLQMTLGGAVSTPVFLPPGGLSQTPYSTLFGRPILTIEHCQSLGTKGDLILADMSQYVLAVHSSGLKTDSSMHVRFVNDETAFRFVFRCDGQPMFNVPITPFKGTTTLSPFVTLSV